MPCSAKLLDSETQSPATLRPRSGLKTISSKAQLLRSENVLIKTLDPS